MGSHDRVALATLHGKEQQLQPAFLELLGWQIVLAQVDTDEFGTFTGDIPRLLPPGETAIQKATRAAQQLGLGKGIASEGTIGPHPTLPFMTVDQEFVAFVDVDRGYTVVESVVSGDIHAVSETWSETTSLADVAKRADLPHHALIIRTTQASPAHIRKGLRTLDELQQAVDDVLSMGSGSDIIIETDFRAMVCPSRQRVIEDCAWKLATRLTALCPECGERGWGVIDYRFGVPCLACGAWCEGVLDAEIYGCVICPNRVASPKAVLGADPAMCDVCNP